MGFVYESFKWGLCRKASNGVCVRKLLMGLVQESFKWGLCRKSSNGVCVGKLQTEFV